ncbi:hypothetical protein I316_01428 [Kwoniella heveanensis BCC8398]|uniref:Transcription factor domain-containing protein n=1 Tax=Kwoniella heveanensis BCC8398 TaxID=1296120 RepID=A0A1B9H0N1_9TREE|nr:hypothetical protein I316_01428 [Kwoniella heveanensis BCC8398]
MPFTRHTSLSPSPKGKAGDLGSRSGGRSNSSASRNGSVNHVRSGIGIGSGGGPPPYSNMLNVLAKVADELPPTEEHHFHASSSSPVIQMNQSRMTQFSPDFASPLTSSSAPAGATSCLALSSCREAHPGEFDRARFLSMYRQASRSLDPDPYMGMAVLEQGLDQLFEVREDDTRVLPSEQIVYSRVDQPRRDLRDEWDVLSSSLLSEHEVDEVLEVLDRHFDLLYMEITKQGLQSLEICQSLLIFATWMRADRQHQTWQFVSQAIGMTLELRMDVNASPTWYATEGIHAHISPLARKRNIQRFWLSLVDWDRRFGKGRHASRDLAGRLALTPMYHELMDSLVRDECLVAALDVCKNAIPLLAGVEPGLPLSNVTAARLYLIGYTSLCALRIMSVPPRDDPRQPSNESGGRARDKDRTDVDGEVDLFHLSILSALANRLCKLNVHRNVSLIASVLGRRILDACRRIASKSISMPHTSTPDDHPPHSNVNGISGKSVQPPRESEYTRSEPEIGGGRGAVSGLGIDRRENPSITTPTATGAGGLSGNSEGMSNDSHRESHDPLLLQQPFLLGELNFSFDFAHLPFNDLFPVPITPSAFSVPIPGLNDDGFELDHVYHYDDPSAHK